MGIKIFTTIKALFWKNWCIRKRHFKLTLVEFFLPVLFCALLVYFNENDISNKNVTNSTENEVIFPIRTKQDIISNSFIDSLIDIVFAPNTTFTSRIMDTAKKNLNIYELNNFIGLSNEEMLEDWFKSNYKNNTFRQSLNGFGIVFNDVPKDDSIPTKLQYKIRNTNKYIWHTDKAFPTFQNPGPMESGEMYFSNGFLAFQIAIDDAFINLTNGTTDNLRIVQPFPYPAYIKNSAFQNLFTNLLPLLIMLGHFCMAPSLVTRVIDEKKSGAREFQKMVGLQEWLVWGSWVIYTMMVYTFTSIALTVCLKISVNGAVLLNYSNPIIIWIMLIIFSLSCTFMYLFISSLFNTPSIGASIGCAVWICSYILLEKCIHSSSLSFPLKFLTAMWPTGSIIWCFRIIANFEATREGVNFENLFQVPIGDYLDLGLGIIFIAMLVGLLIFALLTYYISAVKPGKFGRAKPWYFLFTPCLKYMSGKEEERTSQANLISKDIPVHENESNDIKIGLSIKNLHKTFGSVVAVNKLSLNIYEGQITALLGHNGAGKTTLMSMITGLFSPTSGDVYVDGCSIFSSIEKFQQNLGLCPQHNLLFMYLTASEHMTFFGMLKGLTFKEALHQCDILFEKLNIASKKNELVSKLSGGMKRKLSLAISLVGDPKVLILDEPTSGMDPESRRETWDILLKLRGNRTIIITTHFMEEADVLGDRIAIVDHGEVKCYGSSLFLKKHYGTGYHLIISLASAADKNAITNIVSSLIPDATIQVQNESQIVLNLPTSKCNIFSDLFLQLESSSNLGVSGIGLSCTTMEDVFLKVSGDPHEDHEISCSNRTLLKDVPDESHASNEALSPKPVQGISLFFQRIRALLVKKMVWTYRHWIASLFFIFVFPGFLAFSTVLLNSLLEETRDGLPSLLLSLDVYGSTDVLLSGKTNDSVAHAFSNRVTSQDGSVKQLPPEKTIIQGLLDIGKEQESRFRSSMIVAGNFSNQPVILFSTIGYHASAIAINIYSNALINNGNLSLSLRSIETYNHPLMLYEDESICSPTIPSISQLLAAVWLFMIPLGLVFVTSSFINFAHTERISTSKQLQLMTGVSPVTYWLSMFIWDYFLFITAVSFIFIILLIFDVAHVTSSSDFVVLLFIIIFFGISATWLSYVSTFLLSTYLNSFTLHTIFCILFGVVTSTISNVIDSLIVDVKRQLWTTMKCVFMLNPYYALALSIYKVITVAIDKARCDLCKNSEMRIFCNSLKFNETEYFTWDENGINTELLFLFLDAVLYIAIVFLIEFGLLQSIYYKIITFYVGKVQYNYQLEDIDVATERDRVDNVKMQGSETSAVFVADNLAKKFSRTFTAVHGVSFTASQGECFGLLGVNGAGKTTTFRMLTGDLRPTVGSATILGKSLTKDKLKYLSHIGYCPQIDGLVGAMTGMQMLTMYALLRGLQPSQINKAVNNWILLLGIDEYRDKPCRTYSGGNKRKLSIAIALIGDPPVVFLDEPTSGVDPVARRKLWSVLGYRCKKGLTSVITSHSMDECEAVCDRLTIMVRGQLKCLGNIQHLKQLYGQGYTLLFKLGPHTVTELHDLKDKVEKIYSSNCNLKDEHIGLLHYHLNNPSYQWSALFSSAETLKSTFSIIEDYVISQTTLEQVFLSFAQQRE